jgi:hypothetical protein
MVKKDFCMCKVQVFCIFNQHFIRTVWKAAIFSLMKTSVFSKQNIIFNNVIIYKFRNVTKNNVITALRCKKTGEKYEMSSIADNFDTVFWSCDICHSVF